MRVYELRQSTNRHAFYHRLNLASNTVRVGRESEGQNRPCVLQGKVHPRTRH